MTTHLSIDPSNLTVVTLTGIDERTDWSKLWRLSKLYPFVEWGILYTFRPRRESRYPSETYIKDFGRFIKQFNFQGSVHLCSNIAYDAISGDSRVIDVTRRFSRIQLNVNYTTKEVSLPRLMEFIGTVDKPVITQHNHNNIAITERIAHRHHEVLFDASCGTGRLINNIDYIWNKRKCGYAGGLSAAVLPELLPKMFRNTKGRPFWIDMESSIRTNDLFDIDKAEDVLDTVTETIRKCALSCQTHS